MSISLTTPTQAAFASASDGHAYKQPSPQQRNGHPHHGVTELLVTNSRSLTVVTHDADPYASILAAVRNAERDGCRPVRVNAGDWMTLADIAARYGISREIVRLWSTGTQGPGNFPPPLNPGCLTSFYSWREVSTWIDRHTRYGMANRDDPALVAMNLAIQLRSMAQRINADVVVRTILRE